MSEQLSSADGDRSTRTPQRKATVSIGLPVFNGARYLERTIQSIIDQDFGDFELIIVDNASDDATADIATAFADADRRLRYHRNDENIGAARNYCRAFELATAPYFKWSAHDDWLEPSYLDECVNALMARPDAVLAYTHTNVYDEAGNFTHLFRFPPGLSSDQPATRFHHSLWSFKAPAVFGVIRADVLATTPLIQGYKSSDRPLLSELVLAGPVIEIDAPLFNRTDAVTVRKGRSAANWWRPAGEADEGAPVTFDRFRLLGEYSRLVARTPGLTPVERARMTGSVAGFFARRWPRRALLKESRRWLALKWRARSSSRSVTPATR